MESEINDIDELIGKVVSGEATPGEQQRLAAWSSLTGENSRYFEHIKTIFEKASAQQVRIHFDADAAWNKIRVKLRESESQKERFRYQINGPSILRIAAGIIFLLGAGFFTYQWLNPPIENFAVTSDRTTLQDTLPDGSTAFLNKRSSLAYEYNPREKTRRIKLKGEGFFEVKHHAEKAFVIEAQDVLVRDIGTAFNVKAYPDSDTIEVIVQTGEVQIYTLNNAGIHLASGETGIYSRRLREFSKHDKADTNVLAYKTGILSFNNTYLKTVIENVNEIYDSNIKLENSALASCRITVNFHGDKLETIIEVIAETLNLTVTRNKNEILLAGPGCN